MNHCSLEKQMAQPALPLREGEGSSAVRNGEEDCLRWLFLMNGRKKPQPNNEKHKPQPVSALSPRGVAPQSTVAFCEGRYLVSPFIHQRLPPGEDYPSQSTAIVLQNATVRSEDALSGRWSCLPPEHCFLWI